jgi:hypothetical protein
MIRLVFENCSVFFLFVITYQMILIACYNFSQLESAFKYKIILLQFVRQYGDTLLWQAQQRSLQFYHQVFLYLKIIKEIWHHITLQFFLSRIRSQSRVTGLGRIFLIPAGISLTGNTDVTQVIINDFIIYKDCFSKFFFIYLASFFAHSRFE